MAFLAHWILVALAGLVLIAALLIHRFAPKKRKHVRNVLVLLAVYGTLKGLGYLLGIAGQEAWSNRIAIAAEVIESWAAIGLLTIFLFDLLLPAARLELPTIVTDLVVGLTCLFAGAIILHRHGLTPPSVLATSAVVSGVLALSMQTTLGNILGGLALQLDGTLRQGDWVALENGKQGKVTEIRWRSTLIETRDGATLVVPNASLMTSQVLILGRKEGVSGPARMWVWFRVPHEYPPDRVVRVVEEALRSAAIPNVAANPAPSCVCMDLGRDPHDGSASYGARYWIIDLQPDDPTSSAVRARIHAALRRAGIPIAVPPLTVRTAAETELRAAEVGKKRDERRACVDRVSLFTDLTEEERSTLAETLREAQFATGETITKQGATAHWLYILSSGRAEVRVAVAGAASERVATLEAPDFFGEMGLLTGEPRFADVVAVTDVTCHRLEKAALERIIKARPAIAELLSQRAAERRAELLAVRDHLDEEAKRAAAAREQGRILRELRDFFGIG